MLVAIVGGLLVARYVTLESGLQAVSDRVTEAQDRLREAVEGRAAALAELYSFDIEWDPISFVALVDILPVVDCVWDGVPGGP